MRNKLIFVFVVCIVLFFCYGSVHAAAVVGQNQIFEVSDGIDNFFVNNQDFFDYLMNQKDRGGYNALSQQVLTYSNQYFTYYVEPRQFTYEELEDLGLDVGSPNLRNGFAIYFYRVTTPVNYDMPNYNIVRGSIPGYTTDNNSISYTAVELKAQYTWYVYNYGFSSVQVSSSLSSFYCPTAVLYYPHSVFWDNQALINNGDAGSSAIVSAIQQQTSSLSSSNSTTATTITNNANTNSQREVSAINESAQVVSTSVSESTDRLLSTETQDPDSLGVDNGTTNSGIDTSSLFQSFYTAFTTRDTTVRNFTFTMPNGQSYRFSLFGNILENRLRALNFFEIYQLFYWVAFGTYVIFDFIRIFNYFKNGGFEYAFNTLSPKDDLVKTALK